MAVTGASGFVGGHLIQTFAGAGWRIDALARRETPALARMGITVRPYGLEAPAVPDLSGVDVLIHCAYGGRGADISAAKRLFEQARRSGVASIVFVSSLLASETGSSRYAKEKFAIETMLDPARDIVLRPGLIIGGGGLFEAMTRSISRFPVAPLTEGERPVYTIAIDDLTAATFDIISEGAAGVYLLAASRPTTLRALYGEIGRRAGKRVTIVSLPYSALLATALIAERLGLHVPVTAENLRGLRNLRTFEIPEYPIVKRRFRSLHEDGLTCSTH
ncbi:MAG TPA: NAD(P)H-binding protein [Candidatus Baltobacteraceae bacterium]|nr:NAD(P)H-binding protein [Candidatus Baltobacteraceae bacterium]